MARLSPAELLLGKANKKVTEKGWFTSAVANHEAAGDLYQQAANAFKGEEDFIQAGEAYEREAECRERCKELNGAANAWWNAAKVFKYGGQPEVAIQALKQAIDRLKDVGHFRQCADRAKEVAAMYQELGELSLACEFYEKAGEWYSQEDSTATANQCFKDAANLYAELEKYDLAIRRYQQVAENYLKNPLTKYSVKDLWLRASLCSLTQDTVSAKRDLQKYVTQDISFSSSREYKFVQGIINAIEAESLADFMGCVTEFDEVTKLDIWKTSILLKIKTTLEIKVSRAEPQIL